MKVLVSQNRQKMVYNILPVLNDLIQSYKNKAKQ